MFTDQHYKLLAQTILGEAAGEPIEGQAGVGHVVMNRLNSGRYGKTLEDVLFAPKQFEPWNTRRSELMSYGPQTPGWDQAYNIAKTVARGMAPDPTGGATHFANVATVKARGDSAGRPGGWLSTMGNVRQIGQHTFGNADAGSDGDPAGRQGRVQVAGGGRDFVPTSPTRPNDIDQTTGASTMVRPGGMGGMGGFDPGDFFAALGASLLSSPSYNPLQTFGANLQSRQQNALTQKKLDYELQKDARDFELRQKTFDVQSQNTAGDNVRANAQLELQRAAERRAAEAAKTAGMSEAYRMTIQAFPDLKPGSPPFMEQYKGFAKQLNEAGAGSETFSTQPITGIDANGNRVLLQAGNRGTTRPMALPEGVTIPGGREKIETATEIITRDKATGEILDRTPKNIAEKESLELQGQARGKEIVSAPSTVREATRTLDKIDNLINHPGRQWATGMTSMLPSIPGTEKRSFDIALEEVRAGAFKTAIDDLRGMGALSNTEGQTATAAQTRMLAADTEEGFLKAAREYRKVVDDGLRRAKLIQEGKLTPIREGGSDPGSPAALGVQGGRRTRSGVSYTVE